MRITTTLAGICTIGLLGCVHRQPSVVPLAGPVDCPPRPGAGDRIIMRQFAPSQDEGYTTYIIDGQFAILNATSDPAMAARYTRVLGPRVAPDDVVRAEVFRADVARKRFGACPGVQAIMIMTRSHTWRPYAAHRAGQ